MVAQCPPQTADIQLQMVPLAVVHQHLLQAGQGGVFASVKPHQHAPVTQLHREETAGGKRRETVLDEQYGVCLFHTKVKGQNLRSEAKMYRMEIGDLKIQSRQVQKQPDAGLKILQVL